MLDVGVPLRTKHILKMPYVVRIKNGININRLNRSFSKPLATVLANIEAIGNLANIQVNQVNKK